MVVGMCLAGCPDSKTPTGASSAVAPTDSPAAATTEPAASSPASAASSDGPTAVLKGGWSVHVTSEAPSLNPDMFDTPEKRAKVFFNHTASVTDGQLVVEHKTLNKQWPAKQAVAAELDALMTATSWKELKAKTAAEEPMEGGTKFHFIVTVGDDKVELSTGDLDAHAQLKKVVETLKAVSGVP